MSMPCECTTACWRRIPLEKNPCVDPRVLAVKRVATRRAKKLDSFNWEQERRCQRIGYYNNPKTLTPIASADPKLTLIVAATGKKSGAKTGRRASICPDGIY